MSAAPEHVIVAIDGPAGSGKSTVAKGLAARLGMRYLDTGAMYRSVAVAALSKGARLDDERTVSRIARDIEITFEHEGSSAVPTRVLMNGEDVTSAIRTPEVDSAVSAVSRLPGVREAMVAKQRLVGEGGWLVAEGRDIGTVVFPDATVKVFLTASAEERARRRHDERLSRGESVHAADVHADMIARDTADSTRATGPLQAAEDATQVDTTGMSVDEVIEVVAALVTAKTHSHASASQEEVP